MSGYRILYHHRIRADDGQAVHVRELIWALRRAGHQVQEVALVPKAGAEDATGPAPVAGPGTAAGEGKSDGSSKGSVWQRLKLPRVAVEVLEMAYSRTGRKMLVQAAREFRPHCIYERHALHCTAGLAAARKLGVPLLLEVNSPMVEEMGRLGLLRFGGVARRRERQALSGADRVFAVTQVLADILRGCGAKETALQVVPNGAQPERFGDAASGAGRAHRQRLGIPEDAVVLGFLGYARDWHRLDLVLPALAAPSGQGLHLLIVGAGPAVEPTMRAAEALGVSDRVHAVGAVPPVAVPGWTCAFDMALIPAINGYASPLKLFDSLAAGVLTLAPDQPNLRELLRHGEDGVLLPPDDPGALQREVERLLGDRDALFRMGRAGRERLEAEDWTWDGNARRVAAAISEVMAAGRAGG